MAEVAIHDGAAPHSPANPDRRSSAGSGGQLAPAEPAEPPGLSDELKARLDKVIYSDVSSQLGLSTI